MDKKIQLLTIEGDASIRDAIKQMDEAGQGFIICVDSSGKALGIVTDGDFRRAILQGVDLNKRIEEISNKNFKFLEEGFHEKELEALFIAHPIEQVPILINGTFVDVVNRGEFFSHEHRHITYERELKLPAVIMAGGKGTRLDPFTRVLPKPLIPLGEKTVIEEIMERFAKFGISDFYISINYKGRMIKIFFDDLESDYAVSFIEESIPLGTAGALKFLEGQFNSPFFVSNCDILIDVDLYDLYSYHNDKEYDLTLVASMKHQKIPYGVCQIKNGGDLSEINEKPEYDILVNTGLYIMNPEVIRYIPENSYFDITDLINILKENKKRVGVFPVSEKSWIDLGQWEEYKKALEKFIF